MSPRRPPAVFLVLAALLIVFLLPPALEAQDDSFIAGYATAILDREFAISKAKLTAMNGVITLRAGDLAGRRRDKVVAALSRIKGVTEVRIDETPQPPETADASEPLSGDGWQLFPDGRVFPMLLADPRSPHFSIAYQQYTRSEFPKLRHVGAVSFGEEFSLVRYGGSGFGQLNFALEPAIFAIFDMDAPSLDLVNADYRIGIPLEYRQGPFALKVTPLHQSSHLGDEFLLNTPVQRVNLSYESLNVQAALDLGDFRLYAGGSKLFNHEPADLALWSAQQGAEWMSTASFISDSLAPLAAIDVQEHQETGWHPSISVRTGVELVNPERARRRIQFLLEYYRGYSPNGQFYRERVDWFSVGVHVYF